MDASKNRSSIMSKTLKEFPIVNLVFSISNSWTESTDKFWKSTIHVLSSIRLFVRFATRERSKQAAKTYDFTGDSSFYLLQ